MSKIRNGFVSNSSSSSFIVGIKDLKLYAEYENMPVWIAKMVNKFIKGLGSSQEMASIQELDAYIIDTYGWSKARTLQDIFEEEDYLKEEYDKMKKAIDNGYVVAICEVDYSDESRTEFMSSLPEVDSGEGIYLISDDN